MDSENFTNSGIVPPEDIRGNANNAGANTGNMNMPGNDYTRTQNGGSRMFGFNSPPQQSFNTEEMRGSMQNILAQNVGEYVVVEFLIGTERIMRKQGVLYDVGTSFVTLYDDRERNFIVCDIFSIKFVYFYYPGDRPNTNFNLLSNLGPIDGESTAANNTANTRGRGNRR
jgi:hypothetical protein